MLVFELAVRIDTAGFGKEGGGGGMRGGFQGGPMRGGFNGGFE